VALLAVLLQHFFGLIRHAAGCEDHPTASMFIQLYRLLSIYSLIRLPRRRQNSFANRHLTQPALVVPPAKTVTKRQTAVVNAAECIESLEAFMGDEDLEAVEVLEFSDAAGGIVDNIVYYVGGFVVRHCLRILKCTICLAALSADKTTLPQAKLINIKLRGALRWPSHHLFMALREAEDYVSQHLAKGLDPESFPELIEQIIPTFLPLKSKLCPTHSSTVCAEIAIYYIITRLHWHAKQINKNAKSSKQTKQHRKQAKLC